MTRDELRAPATVRPERGRVLSVFLDLDPSQFGTGDAKLAGSEGRAVAGQAEVHDMLTQRRVETLLPADDHSDRDAVVAALEQDADVLALPAQVPDLERAGGIAALLRF